MSTAPLPTDATVRKKRGCRGVDVSAVDPYLSFDDDVVREAATSDPVGFVLGLPARVTLDEIQRVPQLFTALKSAVDRDRTPGRFLLTGSANVLLLPRLADSPAGRMAILRLHPFAQVEIERTPAVFLDRLLTGGDADSRGLRQLARAAADDFVAGVVLYDGEVSAPFGARLYAVPLRYLWEAM